MKDKVFIDSNIILYAYSETEIEKANIANDIILSTRNNIISTQVINEVTSILFRKFKIETKEIEHVIDELINSLTIVSFTVQTQLHAIKIKQKYRLQYYDCLIIATALENECTILYSEDMQHNQIIDKKLKIINPFDNKVTS